MTRLKIPRTLTKQKVHADGIKLPGHYQTPGSLSVFVMPTAGLKRECWYVVDVAYNAHNPVFKALLYTGLCKDGDMEPGNYAGIANPTSDSGWDAWRGFDKPYYMRVGKNLGPLLLVEGLEKRQDLLEESN